MRLTEGIKMCWETYRFPFFLIVLPFLILGWFATEFLPRVFLKEYD